MANLTLYTDRAIDSNTYEILADGVAIGLIEQIGEDNWRYTLGKTLQSGFKTYMFAFHKATWTHKHAMRYGVAAA